MIEVRDQSTAAPSGRKPKGRLALVLLGLAILFVGGLLALPWILNRPVVMEILRTDLEQRTGLSLSVEAWHIRIFPSIGLELLQLQAHDPGSPTPLFVAERLEMALQWLPLWEGRVVGNDLVIDRPRLTIRRSADGSWSLEGRKRDVSSDDPAQPFAFLQTVRNLLVTDGMVTVVDDSGLSPRIPLHILIAQGTLSSEMSGRHAKLQISGGVPQERDRAAFTCGRFVDAESGGREITSRGRSPTSPHRRATCSFVLGRGRCSAGWVNRAGATHRASSRVAQRRGL